MEPTSPNKEPLAPKPEATNPNLKPEIAQPAAAEQAPQPSNAPAPNAPAGPLSPPQVWPTDQPAVPAPAVQPSSSLGAPSPVPSAAPASAEDVDVIEKEWVEAAEKVVKATNHDPYTEEEAIESLQVDYLKKRYGKEVKKPQDGTANNGV